MAHAFDAPKRSPSRRSRTVGCLLGAAVGDALGAPVQFSNLTEIRRDHGLAGIARFEEAYGRKGAITDDTRMTLFTAEGLILSTVRDDYTGAEGVTLAIYHAYLRWLFTQDTERQGAMIQAHGTCAVVDGVLTGHRELFSRRAPGPTSLAALRSGSMGSVNRPINDSKGCSGLVRVTPIGLAYADAERSFRLACQAAAITHGHPTGYLSAGFMAALISRLVAGVDLMPAVAEAKWILEKQPAHAECLQAIERAIALAHDQRPEPEDLEVLVAGRAAEAALAVGLTCALAVGGDFGRGALMAVNHSGDSVATGSITGAILGACFGAEAIPAAWLEALELKEIIREVAMDLVDRFAGDSPSDL